MSLETTMHLQINDELQEEIIRTHKTAGLYLNALIEKIESTPLTEQPIFAHDVFFTKLKRQGYYTGIIASHFWVGRDFHVKTTSGEVIRVSFF